MNPSEKPQILIIDDAPMNILILARMLSDEYEILRAAGGKEGIALAGTKQPDLIFLDIEMPDMDGYEVCSALKANRATADIPIIIMTAHSDQESEIQALELGAVDFISRPPVPAIVRARTRTHVTLKRQADALRLLSNTDALTGMSNRRHFFEHAELELNRMRRNERALAILMLDIDRFKMINDSYGHAKGDLVLQTLAWVAQRELRQMDIIGRIGGEEFAVLLPETQQPGALLVAERLRMGIERSSVEFATLNPDIPPLPDFTVSIGLTVATKADPDFAACLARADEALYRAKAEGRNRICIAEPPPGSAEFIANSP
ncbi:MAG: diguanylate cyclase [Spirochaetota bacterium]